MCKRFHLVKISFLKTYVFLHFPVSICRKCKEEKKEANWACQKDQGSSTRDVVKKVVNLILLC